MRSVSRQFCSLGSTENSPHGDPATKVSLVKVLSSKLWKVCGQLPDCGMSKSEYSTLTDHREAA